MKFYKKILLIIIFVIIVVFLFFFQIKKRISNIDLNLLSDEELVMLIKENTLTRTSAVVIFIDKNYKLNESEDFRKYGFSSGYVIEKKYGDYWVEIIPKIPNLVETVCYYTKDGMLEMSYNWKKLYGKLGKGKYRIVSEVLVSGNDENGYVYVEFDIN